MSNPNVWAFLSVLVTSLTTILLAWFNYRRSGKIETKLDANTATTDVVHTIVNSRYDALVSQLEAAHAKIAELSAEPKVP